LKWHLHFLRLIGVDRAEQDVSMPVMDGLEATRLIRKFEESGVVRNKEEQPAVESGSAAPGPVGEIPQAPNAAAEPILRPTGKRKTPIIAVCDVIPFRMSVDVQLISSRVEYYAPSTFFAQTSKLRFTRQT
jgi:hypothetical protein